MIKELNLSIWERAFLLPVEYDCYDDEIVTDTQKNAVKMMAMHSEWIVSAKARVECFCKEQVLADNENNRKDNIFSYIKPEYLLSSVRITPEWLSCANTAMIWNMDWRLYLLQTGALR